MFYNANFMGYLGSPNTEFTNNLSHTTGGIAYVYSHFVYTPHSCV